MLRVDPSWGAAPETRLIPEHRLEMYMVVVVSQVRHHGQMSAW